MGGFRAGSAKDLARILEEAETKRDADMKRLFALLSTVCVVGVV